MVRTSGYSENTIAKFSVDRYFLGKVFVLTGGVLIVLGLLFWVGGSILEKENQDLRYYNQGVDAALHDTDKEEALYWFGKVSPKDGELQLAALYNRGTLLGQEALHAAFSNERLLLLAAARENLEKVIAADPDNENAKWNYERLLAEQELIEAALGEAGGGDDSSEGTTGYSPGTDESRGY